jgi:exonuclease III
LGFLNVHPKTKNRLCSYNWSLRRSNRVFNYTQFYFEFSNNNNYKQCANSSQTKLKLINDFYSITTKNKLGRKYKESNKGGYGPTFQNSDSESDTSREEAFNNPEFNEIDNEYKPFKIVTQNIRGFSDHAKQLEWVQACIEEDVDVIGLTETKLLQSSCKSLNYAISFQKFENSEVSYKSWWSTSDQSKGSGVGVMIKSDLAKHVYKIECWKGYAICIDLAFKRGIKMRIMVIYYPATYKKNSIRVKLTNWCNDKIIRDLNPNFYQVIMGDFNAVMNPKVDRTSTSKTRVTGDYPESRLLRLLEMTNFIDHTEFVMKTRRVLRGQAHLTHVLKVDWITYGYPVLY